jgi:hypothetical protein
LKRGMTVDDRSSFPIFGDTKERLNRLVIGVATISADHFRKRGFRLPSPAELFQNISCLDLGEGEGGLGKLLQGC